MSHHFLVKEGSIEAALGRWKSFTRLEQNDLAHQKVVALGLLSIMLSSGPRQLSDILEEAKECDVALEALAIVARDFGLSVHRSKGGSADACVPSSLAAIANG
jgi:hypothetical protein